MPDEGHRLQLVVEMCTAKRPSKTLVGSHERYQEINARLMEAFEARVRPEWAGQCGYQLNPPPDSLPDLFLSAKEGLRYLGTGDPLRGGAAFSKATREDVLKGRQVVTRTVPPSLQLYPLGALEVTAPFHDDALVPPPSACTAPTLTPTPPPRRRRLRSRHASFSQPVTPFLPPVPRRLIPGMGHTYHGLRQVESECLFEAALEVLARRGASGASPSSGAVARPPRDAARALEPFSTGTRCTMRSCSGCARW